MKPVLYLDVDGVLCLRRAPDPSIDDFGDWESVPGRREVYSPSMIAALTALPVERRWLTSWQHEANEALAPVFGWDSAAVLEYRPGSLWWKFDALIQHHPAGAALIWIDDELEARRTELEPMFDAAIDSLDVPYLCLPTWEYRGTTRADVDAMAAFCSDLVTRSHT